MYVAIWQKKQKNGMACLPYSWFLCCNFAVSEEKSHKESPSFLHMFSNKYLASKSMHYQILFFHICFNLRHAYFSVI
jgi:hypothetical protein